MAATIVLANGTRLPSTPGSRVAFTVQDNDITKPDTVQTPYSTTFTLPDDLPTKAALEQAQQGTSTTRLPYGALAGGVEVLGLEVLPRALVQVQGYQRGSGFEVQAFGASKTFYAALGDKKIRQLQLPGAHPWNAGSVATGLTNTGWRNIWAYDILDRGKQVPEVGTAFNIYDGELFPSVYARAIWEQIFVESGYGWGGELPAIFDAITLPAVEAYGYSDETRAANSALVGWEHSSNRNAPDGNHGPGENIVYTENASSIIMPLNYVGGVRDYKAGSGVTIDRVNHTATLGQLGYYTIKAPLRVGMGSQVGRVGAKVSIFAKLGGVGAAVELANDETSTRAFSESVDLEAAIIERLLPAGTVLWVVFEAKDETTSGPLLGEFWTIGTQAGIFDNRPPVDFPEPAEIFSLSIELQAAFPSGGSINPSDWLPDMTCKDYIKSFIWLFGLTQKPHAYLPVIEFYATAPALLAGLPLAPHWDSKIDYSKPVPVKFGVGSFAQANLFKWKEDSTNGPENKDLGNSAVYCPDTTLDPTKDVLTMPYAASPTGRNNLPLVAKWKIKDGYPAGDADKEHYNEATPGPRLLLRGTTRQQVTVADGTNTITIDALLGSFAPLSFAALLPVYYSHLTAALRAPRLLKPYVRLTPAEGINFSQLQPIWLEREGAYFYVNKLDQYEPGQPSTAAELIRLYYA